MRTCGTCTTPHTVSAGEVWFLVVRSQELRNRNFASNTAKEGHEHYMLWPSVLSDGSVKPCMLCQTSYTWKQACGSKLSLTAWLPAGCQHQARLLHHSMRRGAPEAAGGYEVGCAGALWCDVRALPPCCFVWASRRSRAGTFCI